MTYSYENAQGVAQGDVSAHSRPERRQKQDVFQMEEAVAQKLVVVVAMTHSEIQYVFSEGVPVQVVEAVLYFVGQENLFEQLVSRSQRLP